MDVVQGQVGSLKGNRDALRGVCTLIIPGRLGDSVGAAKAAGVDHIVLVSSVGLVAERFSFALSLNGEGSVLRDETREKEVRESGAPFTFVRVGSIREVPGGSDSIAISKDGIPSGNIRSPKHRHIPSLLFSNLLAVSCFPPSTAMALIAFAGESEEHFIPGSIRRATVRSETLTLVSITWARG